jgi:SAM-dependent methyltransferase
VVTNSDRPALSFGRAAAQYEHIRPTYPEAAVRWALGDSTSGPSALGRVIDLAAGTGKLTRVILAATTASVTPVEPDALMREKLAEVTPGVTPIAGSAESIPLPDASVDAVLAGQAYHWFDREKAHAEIARVVRKGGLFAPIWNIRDESVEWVARFGEFVEQQENQPGRGDDFRPGFGAGFGPVQRERFRHEVPMSRDGLVALVRSRSYYLSATPDGQAELLDRIRRFSNSLPPTFPMPYITFCYRAVRS